MVRHYSPMFMQWYASFLFGLAFHSGGYEVGTKEYAAGEWTRWTADVRKGDKSTNPQQGEAWMERAFLFKDKTGNQVWRVRFHDAEKNETTTLEAKFSQDRGQLLRHFECHIPSKTKSSEIIRPLGLKLADFFNVEFRHLFDA